MKNRSTQPSPLRVSITIKYDETPTLEHIINSTLKAHLIEVAYIDRISKNGIPYDVIFLNYVNPESLFALGYEFRRQISNIYPERNFSVTADNGKVELEVNLL